MVIARSIAYKVWIKDLLAGEFIRQEGFNPSFVKFKDKQVSRINMIATAVAKFVSDDENYGALTFDDGTETIRAKAFGPDVVKIKNVKVGALIKFIGKVKKYEDEVYLAPEIIRAEEDPNWLLVRKLELGEPAKVIETAGGKAKVRGTDSEKSEKDEFVEEELVAEELPNGKIARLIKELDKGEGAELSKIIAESGFDEEEAKNLIVGLLRAGDVFEPRKGFLKVLE